MKKHSIKIRGNGSTKEGMHHWWMQRLTAIALIPLSLWFVISLARFANASLYTFFIWLHNPLNSTLMIAFIVSAYHHAQLGMQVFIEDYVHHEGCKISLIVGVKFLTILLGILSILSVLKVAMGGVA